MSGVRGSDAKDRSVITTWVVLVVLLAGLVGLYAWALDNVVPASPRVPMLADTGSVGRPNAADAVRAPPPEPSAGLDVSASSDAAAETPIVDPIAPESTATASGREPPTEAAIDPVEMADDAGAVRRLLAETRVPGAPGEAGEPRVAPNAELADFSEALRFVPRSATFEPPAEIVLDDIATVLLRRPDAPATVEVAGNEHRDEKRDQVLNRERARAVIAGLVNRGVPFERLSMGSTDGGESSPNSQRVRVVASSSDR